MKYVYKPVATLTRTLPLGGFNQYHVSKLSAFDQATDLSRNSNFGISTKYILLIIIAAFLAVCTFLIPDSDAHAASKGKGSNKTSAGGTSPAPAPAPTAVKWHPGHYYTILGWGKDSPTYMAQVYSELEATPALRGIQLRYNWAELETTEGVYDFSSIDQKLTELASRGKRLVVLLQTKSFSLNTVLIPDYLNADIYEGGVFPISSIYDMEGNNIKLWNINVVNRLGALIKALGERYNSHPYFEGIGFVETAMGQPKEPLTSTQINDFFNNLLVINQKARDFFPNTMTFQFANYPRPILDSFISGLGAMGTALGGPDTFIEETGLNYQGIPQGVYNYYPELSGIVPLTPSVMPKNYVSTRSDGTGYQPSVSELLAFARDNLKANYIFWTRDKDYYVQVLEMLNWNEQASSPAGGLNTTCPIAYPSCVE